MASHTSNFDGSESPLTESGTFANGPGLFGSCRKVSGIHCPVAGDEDAASLSTTSFAAAQRSTATWGPTAPATGGSGDYHGVFTRMASSSDGDCYLLIRDPSASNWKLYQTQDTGLVLNFTEIAAWTGSFAASDVIELRSNGSTHEGRRNGTTLGSTSNGTYTTGGVGLHGYDVGTVNTAHGWTSWTGADLLITATANQNTEADTAQTVTTKKTKALGQGSETDTPQAVTHAKRATLGQPSETDSSHPVTRYGFFVAPGQTTEADSAQTVTRAKHRTLGQASEADAAQVVVRGTTFASIGQASEADSAQIVSRAKRRTLGQPATTNTAIALSRAFAVAVAQASATNAAQAVTRVKRRTLGQASSADAALAVFSTPTAFPISAHASGRYLVDANGSPFFLSVRTLWNPLSVTQSDYEDILDDTVAKGFTAVEFELINRDNQTPTNQPPYANNGALLPFTHRLSGAAWDGGLTGSAANFTTPNSSYWAFVDGFIAACEERGLLCLAYPAYVGFDGTTQGWMAEMVSNGTTRMTTYGAFVANRYADRPNIVWMLGGDAGTGSGAFTAGETAVEQALINGLESVTPQASGPHYAALWNTPSIATDNADFDQYITINGAYSFTGDIATQARNAYSHSPALPAWAQESGYDEEGPDGLSRNAAATQPTRRFAYWGWLNAIGGTYYSNGYVWTFNSGWESHINTQAAQDQARLNALVQSIDWWELKPRGLDGAPTLITSGGGTLGGTNYVAAAIDPAGRLAVAYIPPAHTGSVTFSMTAFAGDTRVRWFDPTSGAYTDIDVYPNTGTRSFTVPGNNSQGSFDDWILVFDAVPPLGQSSEQDAAQAVTKLKRKAIGQLVESYTVQAIAKAKARAVAQTSVTDSDTTVTRRKSRAVGQISELDLAQDVLLGDDLGIVEETDTAQDITPRKSVTLGIQTETETALVVSVLKALAVGIATEVDTVTDLGRLKLRRLGQTTETDSVTALPSPYPALPHVVASLSPAGNINATVAPVGRLYAGLKEVQ